EAEANAKTEDPAQREWTEAILTCFNSAGDVDGHLKKLQSLYTAEASDPIWPRRYAQSLISGKKFAEARTVFEKISDADLRDIETALTLNELCNQLKDKSGAEKYFNRAFEALSKQPQRMQQYAQMWQQKKPLWALKAWSYLLDN